MPQFVLTSPAAVAPNNQPIAGLVQALIAIKSRGIPVAIISNHGKPAWFDGCFDNTGVQFLRQVGRQNGEIVRHNVEQRSMQPYDAVVLAANSADIQMGVNGGALLVSAGWSSDRQVQGLGIRIDTPTELDQMLGLSSGWNGHWWMEGNEPLYRVRALANLSGYNQPVSQQEFADKVTATVKGGGARLNALLAITVRSLLIDGIRDEARTAWGVYPSSSSENDDNEVLSDFTHRLRTTVSQMRMARRGDPLFVRHTPSPKRSAGGGGDREDPTSQVETIHVNPAYRGKLIGRHVVVIDDCTTYGLSFGVAAAFLRKAGASQVSGIALGKFGNRLKYYDIAIESDPYKPVLNGGWQLNSKRHFTGSNSSTTQSELLSLIP